MNFSVQFDFYNFFPVPSFGSFDSLCSSFFSPPAFNSGACRAAFRTSSAGRMIEVMTGEKKRHRFSLDDKDAAYSVDGTVAVGKRLTVTDEVGADKVRRITVRSRA